ncbi:hypothetical protein Tco_0600955 [Tanacetum coccineum]
MSNTVRDEGIHCDFTPTNEILFLKNGTKLSIIELRFRVQELLKVMNNVPMIYCEVKGVTTRGGKTTTQDAQDNNTNMQPEEEMHLYLLDKLVDQRSLTKKIDNLNILTHLLSAIKRSTNTTSSFPQKKPELEKISEEEKSSLSQVQEKLKEAEDLAADHIFRFQKPHMEVLTERKIADKFFYDHLMVLKSKSNNDEPWYQYGISWGIDTAYRLPIQYLVPREGKATNVGGVFTNLKILKCWSLEVSRRLFNTQSCS